MTTITIKNTEVIIADRNEHIWHDDLSKPTFRLPLNQSISKCISPYTTCTTCPAAHHTGPTCVSYFTSEFHKLPDTHPEIFL